MFIVPRRYETPLPRSGTFLVALLRSTGNKSSAGAINIGLRRSQVDNNLVRVTRMIHSLRADQILLST